MSDNFVSLNDLYLPSHGGGVVNGDLEMNGNLTVDGSIYGVRPVIEVYNSSKFTGGNSTQSLTLGNVLRKVGDDFTTYDGGVKCNFDGYILASFSVYMRPNSDGIHEFWLQKNDSGVKSGSTAVLSGVSTCLTCRPTIIQVSNGDVIKVTGRTWADSVSFTIKTEETKSGMTVMRIV